MDNTEATIPADVWPRALLEALVAEKGAGIAWDDCEQHCVYCSWHHEDYDATPRHEPTCPIVLGRTALKKD
jgi:hypothetical protein